MIRRLVTLAALALTLVAATPPPPPVLAPYIKDGRFDPGDYGWARGRFADASAEQKAALATITDWRTRCFTDETERVKRELRALGVADPKIMQQGYGASLCTQIAWTLPNRRWATKSFAAFQSALEQARPAAQAMLWAVALARDSTEPRDDTLAEALRARTIPEQMLRRALFWQPNPAKSVPVLTDDARDIAETIVAVALLDEDAANRRWLSDLVAKQGWPTIAAVGTGGAGDAWLLAQHADMDPVFQYRILGLMKPMAERGEASKRNYAYLYDRVMLAIAGRQRYATQMTCEGGKRQPSPLEDPATVDAERKTMGLDPIAKYLAGMNARFGDCPPGG